jgi:hypothetical protein
MEPDMKHQYPASFYEANRAAALRAVRLYFRDRNNCRVSAAYHRDCVRAAIRDVRAANAALA